MKTISLYLSIALLLIGTATASAQCGSVIKAGIKKLNPYTYNNQINSAKLEAGKPAEFHLSFYKGVNYKLLICADAGMGKVNFRVLDENKNEVYNSSNDNNADSWAFFSNSTQELVIEITPVEKSSSGCAAVVVGMQVPKTNNSIRNL